MTVKVEDEEAMVVDHTNAATGAAGPVPADDEAALLAEALGGDAAVAVDATTLERGVEEEVRKKRGKKKRR